MPSATPVVGIVSPLSPCKSGFCRSTSITSISTSLTYIIKTTTTYIAIITAVTTIHIIPNKSNPIKTFHTLRHITFLVASVPLTTLTPVVPVRKTARLFLSCLLRRTQDGLFTEGQAKGIPYVRAISQPLFHLLFFLHFNFT